MDDEAGEHQSALKFFKEAKMANFYTADLHFGHTNIITFEQAKRRTKKGNVFKTVEKMDEYLIGEWNEIVKPTDTVYCLGDFAFKQSVMDSIVPRLNGRKILIVGNHDPFFKRLIMPINTKLHQEALAEAARTGFAEIHLQHDIEISGIGRVRMSHFPYWPKRPEYEQEYNLMNEDNRPDCGGEQMLMHGHIHSQWRVKNAEGFPPQMNVGVDIWNMRPVSETEVVLQYQKELP